MPELTSATGPALALADDRVSADMTPARRRWTLALAGLGAFMSALDVVAGGVAPVGLPIAALSPSKSTQEEVR